MYISQIGFTDTIPVALRFTFWAYVRIRRKKFEEVNEIFLYQGV